MRMSKADGSQVLDLQRDALLGAGVEADYLYTASRHDANQPDGIPTTSKPSSDEQRDPLQATSLAVRLWRSMRSASVFMPRSKGKADIGDIVAPVM